MESRARRKPCNRKIGPYGNGLLALVVPGLSNATVVVVVVARGVVAVALNWILKREFRTTGKRLSSPEGKSLWLALEHAVCPRL